MSRKYINAGNAGQDFSSLHISRMGYNVAVRFVIKDEKNSDNNSNLSKTVDLDIDQTRDLANHLLKLAEVTERITPIMMEGEP